MLSSMCESRICRSPSNEDRRGAFSVVRRITQVEETRAMAPSPRYAAPPLSDYTSATRRCIERARRGMGPAMNLLRKFASGSPRRRREQSPIVDEGSDVEDRRRYEQHRNYSRRPVVSKRIRHSRYSRVQVA